MVSDTGLSLTTPARTVIDLARPLDFRAGVVAADSALHSKLATKEELRSVVAACRHRSGIGQAEAVVDFADPLAESPLESIARVVFQDCGLPAPILQAWLGGTAEPVGRVDFYWRRYRTVAEVDGAIKYADPSRARAQLRRDALLRADGYEVVHFGLAGHHPGKLCIRRRVDQDRRSRRGPAHGGRAARRRPRRTHKPRRARGAARAPELASERLPLEHCIDRNPDPFLGDRARRAEYLRKQAHPQLLDQPPDRHDVGTRALSSRAVPPASASYSAATR